MKSATCRTVLVLLLIAAVCLTISDASTRRRRRFGMAADTPLSSGNVEALHKGTGVQVIGSIEFDEHHDRHDYGGLDYTNHLFKKRFIDYEKSDDHSSDSSHDDHSEDHISNSHKFDY